MAKSKLLILLAAGIFLYKMACAYSLFLSNLVEQTMVLGGITSLMAHLFPPYLDLLIYLLFIGLGGTKIVGHILLKKDIPVQILSVLFLLYLGGEVLNLLTPFLLDFYPKSYLDQLKVFEQTRKNNRWLIEISTTLPIAFLQSFGLFLMFYLWIKKLTKKST